MAKTTPADKSVLDKIINPSKKVIDESVPIAVSIKQAENLADSFANAIANAGRKIKSDTCSDQAKDWLNELTSGRLNSMIKKIDSLSKTINISTGLKGMGKLSGKEPKWEDMICLTAPKVANLIIGVLESALTLVNQLFKKIDKFRKKLERTIVFFLQEVRNCIIDVIMSLSNALQLTVRAVTDLSALESLLGKYDTTNQGCPCLREIILKLLPRSFRECDNEPTGAGFIQCIKDKILVIGDVNLLSGINQWVQENIINKFILTAFDAIEDGVKLVLDTIMRPFRWAIKQYCQFLNKPLPAPFVGTLLPDCLFIHTKEKGKYRMSIIQYLETAKLWTKCFQGICGTLSEDLKRKIKESNENLRLDIKHWFGSHELDLYWSCITTMSYLTDVEKKEIWTRFYIDPFVETLDYIKDARNNLSREEPQPVDLPNDGETSIDENALFKAVTIVNGTDEEMFPFTHQGHLKFYSGAVEAAVVKIIRNLGGAISEHNYYERLNELLRWEHSFIKNQEHLDTIKTVRNKYSAGTEAKDDDLGNAFYSVLPTYKINNEFRVLKQIQKPPQENKESRVEYYQKWYSILLHNL